MSLLNLLSLLDLRLIGLRNVMDELASHAIWTVAVCTKLLAKFCLVQNRHISLHHHVSFSMSEGALNVGKELMSICLRKDG